MAQKTRSEKTEVIINVNEDPADTPRGESAESTPHNVIEEVHADVDTPGPDAPAEAGEAPPAKPARRGRRSRSRKKTETGESSESAEENEATKTAEAVETPESTPKKVPRRRSAAKTRAAGKGAAPEEPADDEEAEAKSPSESEKPADPASPEADADNTEATENTETAAPKPRRRRRTSASKTAPESTPATRPDSKPETRSASTRAPAKTGTARSSTATAGPAKTGKVQMCISYTPGEECRVAVVEDGKLEELHAERASNISRVGNIYVGRVTNVEPAIQAAFVDFGVDHHGFLHVSDIHPRYFPGEDNETTESVGKKTPRRERPPIQRCFRRGDEVIVQVLKEGVGTKGPTLTSYLSVPGRFLVMMPQMDKVGVSRKVEDEDQRREMRKILDQLDLPEGFGFILRTAGMERTKQELKRDLAYLVRLWKDMEGRRGTGNKPRLLYSESDLLVRALRDMLGPEIDEVVIDNELALARAARFLKIVAPRSKVRLLQYVGQTPLFHAFGVEQQIALMHAREVPLPGGGRLVIDETEALVAIDVNSGKMRDARDAETNAYRTNVEAVEEICRQLKLRDLGGIVINDLIDMRLASHRKDIEQRFRDRLKRDRARSTILPISNFGILEMTRQRMRGSHETVHFGDCPTCRGRGIVQKPDSVASDSLRNLAAILDHENVARVEMVVSPRVASELLSSRRKTLNKLERASGKHVDVRVSETIPIDRITFYAYDPTGADIDVDSLPASRPPRDLTVWELPKSADDEAWATDLKEEEVVEEPELSPAEQAELAEMPAHPIEMEDSDLEPGEGADANGQGVRKRRRRRRRRGRGEGSENGVADGQAGTGSAAAEPSEAQARQPQTRQAQAQPTAPTDAAPQELGEDAAPGEAGESGEAGEGGRRRRRRRRRRGGRGQSADAAGPAEGQGEQAPDDEDAPADQAAEIVDPDAPRGDSWDLPPAALPRLTPSPAIARSPEAEPETETDDEDVEPESAEQPAADASAPAALDAESGEQGGAPRRRRRRGGRGGQRDGERKDEPSREKSAEAPAGEPTQSGNKPESKSSGGYRKKSDQPAPSKPGTPRTRDPQPARAPSPAPSLRQPSKPAPPTPAVQPPAPGSGQPAKPKRLLYNSRRKLTPAELARRPKPE